MENYFLHSFVNNLIIYLQAEQFCFSCLKIEFDTIFQQTKMNYNKNTTILSKRLPSTSFMQLMNEYLPFL